MQILSPFVSNLSGNIQGRVGKTSVSKYPWNLGDKNNVFWKPINIMGDRWNKLFPYRLVVIDIKEPNKIVGSGAAGNFSAGRTSKEISSEGNVIITQHLNISNAWEYRLPISPQQLQIVDKFSINTTATMRGVVEEHNGVKFKTIAASGTTGIWPRRPVLGGLPKSQGSLQTIFSGTISAFDGIVESANSVARAFSGDHPATVKDAKTPEETPEGLEGTGYFQALLLGQFLERYAEEKKKPENKDWRLVFDIPKQNQSFIVTPNSFSLKQSEQRPSEHLWSFQLTAWKRIDLTAPPPVVQELPNAISANTFQRVINTLATTRRLLGDSVDLVRAVRSDSQKPFNVLRQTSLAVKDLGGLSIAIGDLPRNIIDDTKSTIEESLFNIKNSFSRGPDTGGGGDSGFVIPSAIALKSQSSSAKAGSAINAVVARNAANEGLSPQAVKDGALGAQAAQAQQTDPLESIFQNPEENFDLFDSINSDELTLSQPQEEAIEAELELVRLIDIEQLREFKEEILSLALDISDNLGAGNQTYSDVYGRQAPNTRVTPMTIEENELLVSLMEVVQLYDILTATKVYDDQSIESSLEFVGGLANDSGISFDQSQNKFLAPVPFGLTLEEIAARYLGDSNKFLEIATINNLKSPYIDEEGFIYNLLSNADGRQFNVDDTEGRLFVGQKITLRSNTVPAFVRKIVAVEKIGSNNFLVTVDGVDDLAQLTTTDGATMQGYLPGTVNSQNQIYIPTDNPADPDDRVFEISHLSEPVLTKLSKVDFLLTDDGDIALNSVGDFRLANGLTNLIQSLKLKIQTEKGTLLRHLDYGLGLSHGISVADIDNGNIIQELNKMIQDDPRFDAIERIDIRLDGNTLAIDMAVTIANQTGIVPVSFDIKL